MLSVAQVRLTLQPGTLLASLDLKDAYWHIPIHRRYKPYLAFSAGIQIYQFKVLPFGLNIAPRVFSKMLQPVQARLVKMGVQILMYLDDWLISAVTPRECRSMIQKTLEIGTSMGLQFNIQKSHLSPTPSIKWLGLIWDKSTATLRLSIDNCRRCCKKIFKAIWLTKPRLSSDSTWQTSITPREPNNIHFSRKRSPHPLSTSTTLSVKMVDKERTLRYSGSMGSTSTSYDTYYRCIRHRMGIPVVHRPSRLRSMDPICKPNSYKCSRVTNSSFSTTERTLNQTNIGFSAVRQFSSHTLPEQARFISVTSPSPRIRVNIHTGKEQRYSHLSFSPSRKIQPVGRFHIQTNLVISGLDLTRTPICITDNPIRETKSRPLCIPNQSTTPSTHTTYL